MKPHRLTRLLSIVLGAVALIVALIFSGVTLIARAAPAANVAAAASNWEIYTHDVAGSGDNTAETTITAKTVSNLKLQWTAHGAQGLPLSPSSLAMSSIGAIGVAMSTPLPSAALAQVRIFGPALWA